MVITATARATFTMDRTHSGITDFSNHFLSRTTAPTRQEGKQMQLRLFIDRASIEAFDGDGRFAMTNLVFPTEPYNTVTLSADGGKARLRSLEVYPLIP